jgi:hypothetical protein
MYVLTHTVWGKTWKTAARFAIKMGIIQTYYSLNPSLIIALKCWGRIAEVYIFSKFLLSISAESFVSMRFSLSLLGLHINELSSVNTLHECKFAVGDKWKSSLLFQYVTSILPVCIYFDVDFWNIVYYIYIESGLWLTICACYSEQRN